MASKKILFSVIIFLIKGFLVAQTITNVSALQEQNNIIISYQLESEEPCKINLFVSNDDGEWKGPLMHVKGNVGQNTKAGDNNITWDVLSEFNELKGSNIRFKVEAVDLIKVGTKYKGGILLYIKEGHGLIAANEDLGFSDWANANIECDNLVLNGFDDWYLPNLDELKLLYLNKEKIGHLTDNCYWSSSEVINSAWSITFSDGESATRLKETRFYFRAIRAF